MAKEKTQTSGKVAPAEKTAKKPVVVDNRPIPAFKDSEGQLKKLRRTDFPKTKDGKIAFCDYQIARWEIKKVASAKTLDPMAKAKRRREKLLKRLAALDAEMAKAQE